MLRQAGRSLPFYADVIQTTALVGLCLGMGWSVLRFGLGLSILPPVFLFSVIPFAGVMLMSAFLAVVSRLCARRAEQVWLAAKQGLYGGAALALIDLAIVQWGGVRSPSIGALAVGLGFLVAFVFALRRLEVRSWSRSILCSAFGGALTGLVMWLPAKLVPWLQPEATSGLQASIWGQHLLERYLIAPGEEWAMLRLVFLCAVVGLVWLIAMVYWASPKLSLVWRGWRTWWRPDVFLMWVSVLALGMGISGYVLGVQGISIYTVIGFLVLVASLACFWTWHLLRRCLAQLQMDGELGIQTPLTLGIATLEDVDVSIRWAGILSLVFAAWLGWPAVFICSAWFLVSEVHARIIQRWSGNGRVWVGAVWAGCLSALLFTQGLVLMAGRMSFGSLGGRFMLALWLSGFLWYLTKHHGVRTTQVAPGLWLFEHRFWVPGVVMVSFLALPVISLQTGWLLPALIAGFLLGGLTFAQRISRPWMQVLRAVSFIMMAFWLR